MKNAILVPLDGTVQAEQAIPVALAVARRTGAEIHPVLVHLTDYFQDLGISPGSLHEADSELAIREADYLQSIAERIAGEGVRVHAPAVLHGEVPDAVAAHAAGHGIGGVVMTTHGRGALERLLVPSVAEGLRQRLSVPMILLRSDSERTAEASLQPSPPLQTVLVALDGSPDADAALDRALEIGGPDAHYVLLRVVSLPPQLSTAYLPQATILRHKDEERLREEAAEYLSSVAARLRARVPNIEKRMGVHSRPGHLIVRAAEEVGADLIAVGGHGHGLLRAALFGSVTHDVLQESGVPVLVARA